MNVYNFWEWIEVFFIGTLNFLSICEWWLREIVKGVMVEDNSNSVLKLIILWLIMSWIFIGMLNSSSLSIYEWWLYIWLDEDWI